MKATVSEYARQQLELLNPEGYRSLVDNFDRVVSNYGDRSAFVCFGEGVSFAEIDRSSRALGSWLSSRGLVPGDRIAIQLPNIAQYPIAAWAALRAGLIIVNTNPLYTPRELIHQFNDSGARALIVLADLLPVINRVLPETSIETVVATNLLDWVAPAAVDASAVDGLVSMREAIAAGGDGELPPVPATLDDVALLQYTSGTTGIAKGVMLTQGNLLACKRMGDETFGNEQDNVDVAIAPMPLYHIYGFAVNVVSGVLKGSLSVLIPDPRNMDSLVETMRQHKFNVFTGINTLFTSLMQHPGFDDIDFSHANKVISGGAPLVEEVATEWQQRTGSQIYEGYGLSESAAGGSINTPAKRQLGSVGIPLKYSEIRVVDETGTILEPGVRGELQIRGPHVTAGYWQRPEATAEVLDAEGWLSTGDVGVIQEDGFIRIVDRIKDMILVSGFNVYPTEIESVVYAIEGVVECAAVGVPDAHSGEVVKLYVASTNPDLDGDAISEHCRDQLAPYKVPRVIEFRESLPKTPVGKILRRELRESNTN